MSGKAQEIALNKDNKIVNNLFTKLDEMHSETNIILNFMKN